MDESDDAGFTYTTTVSESAPGSGSGPLPVLGKSRDGDTILRFSELFSPLSNAAQQQPLGIRKRDLGAVVRAATGEKFVALPTGEKVVALLGGESRFSATGGEDSLAAALRDEGKRKVRVLSTACAVIG